MARPSRREIVDANEYATAADFEQIFTEDMSGLYLLTFLLAGDRDKAEECFVAGIAESTKAKRVFKEWARSWVRRTIIQSAIRIIVQRQHSENAMRSPAAAPALDKLPLVLQAEVSAIVEMAPLERFVFVMSVLERYSDHDCSILLGCPRSEVTVARTHALRHLGTLMSFQKNEIDSSVSSAVEENPVPVINLTIARYFATQAWNKSLSQHAPVLAG